MDGSPALARILLPVSKVVVSMFLSLDGFVVGPKEEIDWVINNFDSEGMGADMSKLQANAAPFS